MKTPWLPIYVVSCALGAFFLVSGATYWNWEIGSYAAIVGAVFGFLGYLTVRYGPKRTDYTSQWAEILRQEQERGDDIMDLAMRWRQRVKEARDLLKRARPYVGSAPFEGSLILEQAIEAFLYREKGDIE